MPMGEDILKGIQRVGGAEITVEQMKDLMIEILEEISHSDCDDSKFRSFSMDYEGIEDGRMIYTLSLSYNGWSFQAFTISVKFPGKER